MEASETVFRVSEDWFGRVQANQAFSTSYSARYVIAF